MSTPTATPAIAFQTVPTSDTAPAGATPTQTPLPIPLSAPQGTALEAPERPVVDPNRTVVTQTFAQYVHPRGKNFATSKRIVRLDYSDGSIGYKCVQCDYERPKFSSVFAHTGTHSPGRNEKISAAVKARHAATRGGSSLVKNQIIDLLDKMDADPRIAKLEASVEEYRSRALAAEATVRKMQATFRSLMGE